jgi:hypothetical protein
VQACSTPDEFEAMGLAERELDRLERYKRRALSRRKQAIETFMAISYGVQALAVAQCRCNTWS